MPFSVVGHDFFLYDKSDRNVHDDALQFVAFSKTYIQLDLFTVNFYCSSSCPFCSVDYETDEEEQRLQTRKNNMIAHH